MANMRNNDMEHDLQIEQGHVFVTTPIQVHGSDKIQIDVPDFFDSTPVAYLAVTADGSIVAANSAAEELLCDSNSLLQTESLFERIVHPCQNTMRLHLARAAAGEKPRQEALLDTGNASKRHVELRSASLSVAGYSTPLIVIAAFDISGYRKVQADLRRSHDRMRQRAYHDPLTGLPNRMLFHDRLRQAISRAQRSRKRLGVLFIDLDKFKQINDSLGHAFGDRVLQTIARRLKKTLRDSDTVSRLGGDEFAVIIEGISHIEEAVWVCDKLQTVVSKDIQLEEHCVQVGASIGLSIYPDDSNQAEWLVNNADTAMYRAKALGRRRTERFDSTSDRLESDIDLLRDELPRALENGQIQLFYQPQWSVELQSVVAYEAFVRWDHPERGLLMPEDIMRTAENSGHLDDFTYFVLERACLQCKHWQAEHGRELRVSVNISPSQIASPNFGAAIANALSGASLKPSSLELELTEAGLLEDYAVTAERLGFLHKAGVNIAIDDFGTGYSSLNALSRFPLTRLKLDSSFVSGLPFDPENRRQTQAVIGLAQALDFEVVAEGVETSEQAAYLSQQGCSLLQGFYFGRPMPVVEVEHNIAKLA